jgi:hypothetical protein
MERLYPGYADEIFYKMERLTFTSNCNVQITPKNSFVCREIENQNIIQFCNSNRVHIQYVKKYVEYSWLIYKNNTIFFLIYI